MYERVRTKVGALALAALVGGLVALALAGSTAAAVGGCGSYRSQGQAQDAFVEAGGGPGRNLGNLDPDRDGVACEVLPAPFKGYATIGYNSRRQFFYGTATLPATATAEGAYPCLSGDSQGDEGPRRVNVFRVTADGDKALLGEFVGTEPRPESGRVMWKIARKLPAPGRYYASFEARLRLDPYGPTDCPGFSSRPTALPQPSAQR